MEVLREIRNSIKPEDAGVDVKSIRRIQTGDIFAELESRTDKKNRFYESVQSILDTKAIVSSLKSRFTLQIRDLSWLANKAEVDEIIKRDYLDVSNFMVEATSVNS